MITETLVSSETYIQDSQDVRGLAQHVFYVHTISNIPMSCTLQGGPAKFVQ